MVRYLSVVPLAVSCVLRTRLPRGALAVVVVAAAAVDVLESPCCCCLSVDLSARGETGLMEYRVAMRVCVRVRCH